MPTDAMTGKDGKPLAAPGKIRLDDDAAFKLADGMTLGSMAETGNLRIVVSVDGKDIAIELPNKWLHGQLGLAAFIRANCHIGRKAA
jgi:hypothetical protein